MTRAGANWRKVVRYPPNSTTGCYAKCGDFARNRKQRRLSRAADPSVYVKALRFLHDYTAQTEWATHDDAESGLRATNAFAEFDDAPRLRLLRPARPT